MMYDPLKIENLKERVYALSNEHCYIERERFLATRPAPETKPPHYYSRLIADMLDSVSTPIDENDIFVGRAIEGPPEGDGECPNRTIFGKGHLTPNYEKLLSKGYKGVLDEIRGHAARLGTEKARLYLENAEIVVEAIRRFAARYSEAARLAGFDRASEALLCVPYEPAYDLYSALQGMWILHMISSCYVGARDYGFGYMDDYLYPYYLKEKERGTTDDEIRVMLAGFFVKPNEICGRHPHNYQKKPVLCQSAKQYVLLDGGKANELSELILDAARMTCMAQPEFTVILSKDAPESFRKKTFETMAAVTDKLQVYSCELLKEFLVSREFPQQIVDRPAFTACCTFDIYQHTCREEFYLPTVQVFCKTLFENEFSTKEELLRAYAAAVTKECEAYVEESRDPGYEWASGVYLIDAMLLSTCNERCEYPPYGQKYRAKNIFLPGIATLGDSLYVLDKLVFRGDVPYAEFVKMLKADFVGYDDLYARIAACPRFGNDGEADAYAVEMSHVLLKAVADAKHTEQEVLVPSFYSLERNNVWAEETPATPDGRREGTPFSENQSPVYGADRSGITALLNSIARLPFAKTGGGGLNLTFSSHVEPEILRALVKTYFEKGGMHVGMTVLDREVLQDAMKHPEKYRSLTVRLYGFSEYFISLPEWQQIAVLNRTAYGA